MYKENFNFENIPISSLSLYVSCGCNLQCKYCQISQNRNEFSADLQKNTIQALKDGTFLQNVKNSLIKLGIPFDNIKKLSLWGQEPTLTLDLLTEHLEDWLNTFSSVDNIFFSTNTMAFPEKVINFVEKANNYAELKKKPFSVDIQFSYDGEFSTDNIREGSSSKIYENLTKITQECNAKNYYKDFKFSMFVHSVISRELLKTLNTFEKVEAYYTSLEKWIAPLRNMVINRNIFFNEAISPAVENPVLDGTTVDGIEFANFVRTTLMLAEKPEYAILRNTMYSVLGMSSMFERFYRERQYPESLTDFLENAQNDPNQFFHRLLELGDLLFCGSFVGELKFMYDGTMIGCQNNIFDTNIEGIPDDRSIKNSARRSLAQHGYYVNVLTEENGLEKYKTLRNRYCSFRFEALPYVFHQLCILMFWMAEAGQIDPGYKRNAKKISYHAMLLTGITCCAYNNQVATGSTLTRDTGYIRFYCNGLMDLVEEYIHVILPNQNRRPNC